MPPSRNSYLDKLHAELKETMNDLVGNRVRVAIVPDGFTRNTFGPQIAVAGILECKTADDGTPRYRVIVDNDNFAYFTLNNIVLANTLASVPTITLRIPVVTEDDLK